MALNRMWRRFILELSLCRNDNEFFAGHVLPPWRPALHVLCLMRLRLPTSVDQLLLYPMKPPIKPMMQMLLQRLPLVSLE